MIPRFQPSPEWQDCASTATTLLTPPNLYVETWQYFNLSFWCQFTLLDLCTFLIGSGWRNFFCTGGRLGICLKYKNFRPSWGDSNLISMRERWNNKSLSHIPGELVSAFWCGQPNFLFLGLLHLLPPSPLVLFRSLLFQLLFLWPSSWASAFLQRLVLQKSEWINIVRDRMSVH